MTKSAPQDTLSTMTLQSAVVRLTLSTPLIFGKQIDQEAIPKLPKETHDAYEKRTWRERCHVNGDGNLFVPARAFKKLLENTAKYRGDKIKGHGQKTWTAKFRAGLSVEKDMVLLRDGKPIKQESIEGMWKSVPSNGQPGGATRVKRCFPTLDPGVSGEVRLLLLDPFIQKEVVEEYFRFGGVINGLGVWRPQVGGSFGRFTVDSIEWSELAL
jgi:hypothetical protein